jgi:protein O-GlcNAc transferase
MDLESRTLADRHIALGHAREDGGAFDAALACYLDAVSAAPDYPRAHLNLGSALELLGRTDDAIAALQRALALDLAYAPAHYNLGKLYAAHRQYDAAERELKSSLRLAPSFVDAAIVLAGVYEVQGKGDQAESELRSAAAHGSGSAGAAQNLGLLLKARNRLDEAEQAFAQALALDPDFADASVAMGNLYLQTRRARDAEPFFRKALALSPGNWEAASNLLFSMNVRDDVSARSIHHEHINLAATLQAGVPSSHRPERGVERGENAPRKLRIGYVSGDFGHHPVGLFMRPVLANHDRNHFEIHCYCNQEPDLELTRELKATSDRWRDISDLSDDEAASLIRGDAIDVLVDLSGYTAGSRLPVFMRRPATVQASWLGYLNTTGLDSIDYRITDRYADPPGSSEHLYSERLMRLPHSQWCYQPYYQVPLPSARDDRSAAVVFGSFNQFAKLSDACLALWCEILKQAPGTTLRVIGVPGKHAESVLRSQVEAYGVDPGRIEAVARLGIHDYFAAIGDVDIALDTFPYNGATTTLDTLWMGVPVIALAGNTAVARSSLSILNSLSVQELIAASAADLVARNVALASDPDRREALRKTLRARLEHSSLMDAAAFTRGLEDLYRNMWGAGSHPG